MFLLLTSSIPEHSCLGGFNSTKNWNWSWGIIVIQVIQVIYLTTGSSPYWDDHPIPNLTVLCEENNDF